VRSTNLVDLLADLIDRWRAERESGEPFGDWADRTLFQPQEIPQAAAQ
jgi:sulfite reductase beta subunit-like hemoprotein